MQKEGEQSLRADIQSLNEKLDRQMLTEKNLNTDLSAAQSLLREARLESDSIRKQLAEAQAGHNSDLQELQRNKDMVTRLQSELADFDDCKLRIEVLAQRLAEKDLEMSRLEQAARELTAQVQQLHLKVE